MQQVKVPRNKKTLEFYLDKAIPANLAQVFLQLTTGETIEKFYHSVLIPMAAERVFGDELLKYVYDDGGSVNSIQILHIACGYLTEAKFVLAKGDRRGAWSCAVDAIYYCGLAKNASSYVNDLSAVIDAEIDLAVSNAAAKAADSRVAPYKDVGTEAVSIIRTRGEKGDRWKSAKAAATEILDGMFDLAKAKGTPFYATDRGLKTITGYLTAAPELGAFFTEKRGRPKKKRS